MKPYSCEDCYDFENYESDNEDFFTCSERQFLLKNLLYHVLCEDESIKHVVGYKKIKVYKERPISKNCAFSSDIDFNRGSHPRNPLSILHLPHTK